MSYSEFLLIFLACPLTVLVVLTRRLLHYSTLGLLLVLSAVALAYTGPWDNLLVAQHVWSFSSDRVSGLTIGLVPVEEYIFYVMQVAVTGVWTVWLAHRLVRR